MDNNLRIGVIHIVEWLRPDDLRTGWELFGEVEPLGIASKPEVFVRFWRAATRQDFLKLLKTFAAEFQENGRTPLLHIETHGSVHGIGVSAAEWFYWADLMEELIPLNRLTRLNLTVIIAACDGIWGTQMLQPDRRAAAFRGLIGPNREICPQELSDACLALYRTVLAGQRNGDAAIKAMNDKSAGAFSRMSAETAFRDVYHGYLRDRCTPDEINRRVEEIVQNASRRRREQGLPGRYRWEIDDARAIARAHILDHRGRFEEMRNEFFFIDLYPENAARFDVSFEDCQP